MSCDVTRVYLIHASGACALSDFSPHSPAAASARAGDTLARQTSEHAQKYILGAVQEVVYWTMRASWTLCGLQTVAERAEAAGTRSARRVIVQNLRQRDLVGISADRLPTLAGRTLPQRATVCAWAVRPPPAAPYVGMGAVPCARRPGLRTS